MWIGDRMFGIDSHLDCTHAYKYIIEMYCCDY